MSVEYYTIGILMLFSAMLPGADFVMVTKNSLLHSRRAGLFTSLGIATGLLVHITYCILGLAVVISQSIVLFNLVKFLGAGYLIYIGIVLARSKSNVVPSAVHSEHDQKTDISPLKAFKQGFLCNVLNPKCSLFFLALFTLVIKPDTSYLKEAFIAAELYTITLVWFCCVALLFSHDRLRQSLMAMQKYLNQVLGGCLIVFGACLALIKKH